jgi:hypothetical protein
MFKVRNTILIILLFTLTVFSASATYQLVLQSGHEGAPVAVEWHDRTDTIVSVGEDGRLIITRPRDNKVLHRFRITSDRVHDLKVDPSDNRAAVVTSNNGVFTVSVWDWSDEDKVYDYELESEPLFTCWSARGRYLTIGNLGTPSVVVLEGRTGRRLSYLQRLPSLYNAGYIGSTETILMTYNTSGAIRYWDIRSSALKLSAETVSNLQGVTVMQTDSKTSLFGYKNESLYLVNRQTGVSLDELEIDGLRDVSIDNKTGDIDVLVTNLTGSSLHKYVVRDERFVPRGFGISNISTAAVPVAIDTSIKPVIVLRRNNSSYLMTETGNLIVENSGGISAVVDDRLWRPDSMAFDNESIFISGSSKILRFSSPFFAVDSEGNSEDLSTLTRDEIYTGSKASETGIEILADGDILLWDKASEGINNGIRRIRFNRPEDEILFPVDGMIQKLDIIDDQRILTVDRNGNVSIIDPEDGEIISSYSALGILDSAFSVRGGFLLTGKSSTGSAGTALEQVDVQTREAIPVSDDRFMIYRIESGSRGFYSIGITRNSSDISETSLLQHDENRMDRPRKLLEVSGEDLDAVVLPNPDGNEVFTSLGGSIQRIAGSRKTSFPWTVQVRDLSIRGEVLYGLDQDGAIVLWNTSTGRAMLSIFFFDDGGWIAMPPDGDTIWASPGAIENVVLYKDGRQIDPRRVSKTVDDRNPLRM